MKYCGIFLFFVKSIKEFCWKNYSGYYDNIIARLLTIFILKDIYL